MSYSKKLKDPRWQKKRLEILQRDDWTCQKCGLDTNTLTVHHFKYVGEPWEADNKDLMTLCMKCHKKEHDDVITKIVALMNSKKILLDDLLFFLQEFDRNGLLEREVFWDANISALAHGLSKKDQLDIFWKEYIDYIRKK